VNKKTSILQINGQPYDAVSGQPIGSSPAAARNLDGIIGGHAGAKARPSAKSARSVVASPPRKPTSIKRPAGDIPERPATNPLPKHQPEHAKTLMRRSVPKPGRALKRQVRAQGEVQLAPGQTVGPVAAKLSIASIDPHREQRAEQIARSPHIRHFNPLSKSRPAAPSLPLPAALVARPKPVVHPARVAISGHTKKPSMDIFERALSQATAHQEPPFKPISHRKFSKRIAGTLAVGVSLLLVGGFLTYRNVPNIDLHLASARAGFTASLPGYQPAGFSLGPFTSAQGEVDVHFKSNSDQRAFTVTEKDSNWDSATLRDSYVITKAGQNYETINAGDSTIYVYGQNNATWVSGGVWYTIQTNGALSTQQLIQIANSL
jgi:hypothetical protein